MSMQRIRTHPCPQRYQKTYRELAKKHPSFRERSEVTELIVEISLQPWHSFRPDGVILFSDILTPLPGIGVQVWCCRTLRGHRS